MQQWRLGVDSHRSESIDDIAGNCDIRVVFTGRSDYEADSGTLSRDRFHEDIEETLEWISIAVVIVGCEGLVVLSPGRAWRRWLLGSDIRHANFVIAPVAAPLLSATVYILFSDVEVSQGRMFRTWHVVDDGANKDGTGDGRMKLFDAFLHCPLLLPLSPLLVRSVCFKWI